MILGEITQARLNSLVKDHELWLSDNSQGQQLILNSFDLSGMTLKGNISWATFIDCDFSHTTFANLQMDRVVFNECNFSFGLWRSCKATEIIDFNKCTAKNTLTIIGCQFGDLDFEDSEFNNLTLRTVDTGVFSITNSSFPNLVWEKAKILEFELVNVNLKDGSYSEVYITYFTVNNVYFNNSSFNGGRVENNLIDKMDFTGVSIEDFYFIGVGTSNMFKNVTFNEVILNNFSLSGSNVLINCDFTNASINNTSFTKATMKRCDFSSVKLLKNVNFIGSKAYKSIFSGLTLENINFTEAHLSKVDFTNAIFINVNFHNSDLTVSNLSGATLNDAVFEGASLSGATFPQGQICIPGSVGTCAPR